MGKCILTALVFLHDLLGYEGVVINDNKIINLEKYLLEPKI